jgi:hypothetical protein
MWYMPRYLLDRSKKLTIDSEEVVRLSVFGLGCRVSWEVVDHE